MAQPLGPFDSNVNASGIGLLHHPIGASVPAMTPGQTIFDANGLNLPGAGANKLEALMGPGPTLSASGAAGAGNALGAGASLVGSTPEVAPVPHPYPIAPTPAQKLTSLVSNNSAAPQSAPSAQPLLKLPSGQMIAPGLYPTHDGSHMVTISDDGHGNAVVTKQSNPGEIPGLLDPLHETGNTIAGGIVNQVKSQVESQIAPALGSAGEFVAEKTAPAVQAAQSAASGLDIGTKLGQVGDFISGLASPNGLGALFGRPPGPTQPTSTNWGPTGESHDDFSSEPAPASAPSAGYTPQSNSFSRLMSLVGGPSIEQRDEAAVPKSVPQSFSELNPAWQKWSDLYGSGGANASGSPDDRAPAANSSGSPDDRDAAHSALGAGAGMIGNVLVAPPPAPTKYLTVTRPAMVAPARIVLAPNALRAAPPPDLSQFVQNISGGPGKHDSRGWGVDASGRIVSG